MQRNMRGITIKGNQIDGEFGTSIAPIFIFADSFEMANVNLDNVFIEDNIISVTTSGTAKHVRVYNYAGTGTVTGVTLRNNNLISLRTNTPVSATIDAVNNYWGSAVLSTIQANISGNITFTPYYVDEGMTTLSNVNPATIYVDSSYSDGNAGSHIFGYDAFSKIQNAINAAASGTTINVAAGTYNEAVVINKAISLIGAGRDQTIITGGSPVVSLNSTGSISQPIRISDLKLLAQNSSVYGIKTDFTPISYVELNNIDVVQANNYGVGIRIGTSTCTIRCHKLDHLTITNSLFQGFYDGFIVERTPGAGVNGTELRDVTITDTIFKENKRKGLYLETLSNAVFTNVQILDNGRYTLVTKYSNLASLHAGGIDINLKDGNYAHLEFNNLTVTGNGVGTKEGAGIMIKARGTGLDTGYATYPAYLDDVTINGGSFTNNERGIRFGEPNKNVTGVTNVKVNDAIIKDNVREYNLSDGSNYGGVVNTLHPQIQVDATENWWGSAVLSTIQANISGNVSSDPFLCEASPTTWVSAGGVCIIGNNVTGGVSDIETTGVTLTNITINGTEQTDSSQKYFGEQNVSLFSNSILVLEFPFNFSNSTLDLSKIEIEIGTNYVIINMSGVIQEGFTKTVYMEDEGYDNLCVKDSDVVLISEVSKACNGASETIMNQCLHVAGAYTKDGISCTKTGTTLKIENLTHSAVLGTNDEVTDSGDGGNGGSGIVGKIAENESVPVAETPSESETEQSGELPMKEPIVKINATQETPSTTGEINNKRVYLAIIVLLVIIVSVTLIKVFGKKGSGKKKK